MVLATAHTAVSRRDQSPEAGYPWDSTLFRRSEFQKRNVYSAGKIRELRSGEEEAVGGAS